jgi:hypothetical protein
MGRWYKVEWQRNLAHLLNISLRAEGQFPKFKDLKERYKSVTAEHQKNLLEVFYDASLLKYMQNRIKKYDMKLHPPYTIDFGKLWVHLKRSPYWPIYETAQEYINGRIYDNVAALCMGSERKKSFAHEPNPEHLTTFVGNQSMETVGNFGIPTMSSRKRAVNPYLPPVKVHFFIFKSSYPAQENSPTVQSKLPLKSIPISSPTIGSLNLS